MTDLRPTQPDRSSRTVRIWPFLAAVTSLLFVGGFFIMLIPLPVTVLVAVITLAVAVIEETARK